MKILNFKEFMTKYDCKNDTMNESELQRVCNFFINPRGSKIYSDKRFVFIDDGSMGGSHWVCSILKDNKSICFDNFGGNTDNVLLHQLP